MSSKERIANIERLMDDLAESKAEIVRLRPLLPAAKDVREAMAAAMRIMEPDEAMATAWLAELARLGISDGWGRRLDDAIKAAEAAGGGK